MLSDSVKLMISVAHLFKVGGNSGSMVSSKFKLKSPVRKMDLNWLQCGKMRSKEKARASAKREFDDDNL